MSLAIRPARRNDLPAVEALLRAASLPVDGVAEAFDHFVVADADGAVVAVAGLEVREHDALVRSVAVTPSLRGTGVGHRLIARILAEARALAVDRLWLLTLSASEYFHRFGFRAVSREDAPPALQATVEFHHACPATAAVMVRRMAPLRVLVLCTANVARSQLAEALLRHRGGDLVQAASAGAVPGGGAHPLAVAELGRRGIEWSGKRSQGIEAVAAQPWDLVITVCDPARDACPVLPGAAMVHWDLVDPVEAGPGEQEQRAAFAATADALDQRIGLLLELPLALYDRERLAREATALHRVD
ncbi:MAG: arsenic resistance N-acetyltransferase ArsN2 [Gemmatimonadota bacterium]